MRKRAAPGSGRESLTAHRIEEVCVSALRGEVHRRAALWCLACVRAHRDAGIGAADIGRAEDVGVRPQHLDRFDTRGDPVAGEAKGLGTEPDEQPG